MTQCNCNVGPGKFGGESALVFMAYQQMCLGNVDTTVGRYDFFKAPFMFDADQSVVKAALDYGYCESCIENHDDLTTYGMVIYEDDSGFVYSQVFENEADYDRALENAENEESDEGVEE